MSNKDSVLKLLEEKDKYKQYVKEYEETFHSILGRLYCIGGPLNDNLLRFDHKQRKLLARIANEIRGVLRS